MGGAELQAGQGESGLGAVPGAQRHGHEAALAAGLLRVFVLLVGLTRRRSRARTVALLEELCRQNERFHGEETAWRIQLDKVALRLVYADSTSQHPGN